MSNPPTPGTPQAVQAIAPDAEAPVVRPASPLSSSFSQQKWVQDVLPWVTSGVLHLGIIITVVLLAKVVQVAVPVVREQIIVPDAAVMDNAPVGGVPNPGLGQDPNRLAAQDQVTDSNQQQVRTAGQKLNEAVAGGAEGSNESLMGIGRAQGFTRGKGNGTGSGDGGGDKAGGLFGVPGGGGGGGPKVNFVGLSGNATKIVYLCDASGSMLSVFPALQRQLRMSIDALRPIQAFGVVMFSDNSRPLAAQLVMANPDNKKKAFDFVGTQSASGGTKPSGAIAQAFAMQPQLIYVLTDGFDQGDPKEILEQFRKLNREKKVKVNTIRIRAAEDPELVKLLQAIATESGGVYREVDRDDF